MLRRTLLISALVGFLCSLGCRQDTNPPPRFNKPMSLGNQKFMPLKPLTQRADESLLASIASDEKPAASSDRRSDEEPAVKLDDSTAKAAADSYTALLAAGQLAELSKLLVPEQADVLSASAGTDVILPVAEAAHELEAALDAQIPGHAVQIMGLDAFAQRLVELTARVTIEDIKPLGDDEAEGTLLMAVPNGEPKKEPVKIRRSDSGWRIELPNLQKPDDLDAMAQNLKGKAEGFRDLAQRVKSGELKDEATVRSEIDKVLAGTYEPPPPPAEQAPPAEENQAAPQAEPYRQPRQRDAVDDTIAVPGVLNRG